MRENLQDLVERREKGVMREHQIAISRMHTLKKHQDKLHARKDNLAPEIVRDAYIIAANRKIVSI